MKQSKRNTTNSSIPLFIEKLSNILEVLLCIDLGLNLFRIH